jgi:AcrR family transcriptional regulator
MTAAERGRAAPDRRTRGSSAGLDLPRIIAAARTLPPEGVTMKAVADVLGVDRSALNHHVSGRDLLLSLVASDVFSSHAAAIHIPDDQGWQGACRAYAFGFCDALISTGTLTQYFRASTGLVPGLLVPAEAVLLTLTRAGFDDEVAARSLSMLSNLCLGFARDVMLTSTTGGHPQMRQVRLALEAGTGSFETIARMSSAGYESHDGRQLEFDVEVFIHGLEVLDTDDSV